MNYDNRDFDRNNRADYGHRDNRDSGNGGNDGKMQLFFAKGRNDQITDESLIDFIATNAQIDETVISGIKILDAFSFFIVPQEDAEIILDYFQEVAGEGRPLVSKAKRKSANSGDNRRNDRRDDRRGGNGGGYRNNDRNNDRRRDDRGSRNDSYGNSFGGNDRRPKSY